MGIGGFWEPARLPVAAKPGLAKGDTGGLLPGSRRDASLDVGGARGESPGQSFCAPIGVAASYSGLSELPG